MIEIVERVWIRFHEVVRLSIDIRIFHARILVLDYRWSADVHWLNVRWMIDVLVGLQQGIEKDFV